MGNNPAAEIMSAVEVAAPKWSRERLLSKRHWTERMFSFVTTRSADFAFTAGQFGRIGVDDGEGGIVWRPHSMVSAADAQELEFLTVVVPEGAFTSRLARLNPGDPIYVEKTSYGFLTADRFTDGRDLWMLASGTGLGPYLSILAEAAPWQDYENLIVVHSVRRGAELAYRDDIAALAGRGRARLHYLPVVTREPCPGALDERLPRLIENGRMERAVGLPLDLDRSRLMICGNPEMAKELRQLLTGRGFRVSRRADPGHLVFENYW